jgi:hypothetical protein
MLVDPSVFFAFLSGIFLGLIGIIGKLVTQDRSINKKLDKLGDQIANHIAWHTRNDWKALNYGRQSDPRDRNRERDPRQRESVPMIIHRERVMRGTEIVETVHGPMPVSEWDAYAKEKGL